MRSLNDKNGITLVALVITIIILIILAGVTFNTLLGEGGLITKAKYAAGQYAQEQTKEQELLNSINKEIVGVAIADVNGNVPEGYIKPSGTKQITENGEYDIKNYEKVNVNVSSTGSSNIDRFLTNGQISSGSQSSYLTAYFDKNISTGCYIVYKITVGDTTYGPYFLKYTDEGENYDLSGHVNINCKIYNDKISCEHYGGSWYDIYIDMATIDLSSFTN